MTGDLGFIGKDGQLRISGRSKDVIVLDSGKNVHPEEIERHLERSPLIKEVCVVGRKVARAASVKLFAAVVPDMAMGRRILRSRPCRHGCMAAIRGGGAGMPAPRTTSVSCGWTPAGTSSSTGPSRVGTSTVLPSAASGADTSTAVTRSSPSRTKRGSSRTWMRTYRSPGGPPRSPAWPRPAIRIRWPSEIPAGTSTENFARSTLRPLPRQDLHGSRGTRPSPWQASQAAARTTCPNGVLATVRSWPAPPQREQVSIGVPGSAPLPRQCSHSATTS